MSDDRRFLDRVASGREPDPCSYRCWAKGCTQSTGYQPDKTATGMRLLTKRERDVLRDLGFGQECGDLRVVGSYTCPTHAPRVCRHCGAVIPWFDGSVCDYCDRYDDDGGCGETDYTGDE